LEIVGESSATHPVNVMLSRKRSPGEGVVFAPAALIRKVVVLEPVVGAV
jgi:hypothetical protein